MKKAMITGITGQDGSYLSELLLGKGYEVHGIVRPTGIGDQSRINHLVSNEGIFDKKLFLHRSDLLDGARLQQIIHEIVPDEFYHLAGQSHPALSFKIPERTCNEVANATLRLLETFRAMNQPPRFFNASSAEVFGKARQSPQNEATPRQPISPYGAAKAFAMNVCEIYREVHGMFLCNGILYNHESPRRGEDYVTMKICREVAKIKLGQSEGFSLGDTSPQRDWGYAPDYVGAMWSMLQQDQADDYILATGVTHTVQDVVDVAFDAAGISSQGRVKHNPRFTRPAEPRQLVGDATRARGRLKWQHTRSFEEMITEMVESQLNL